MMGDNIMEGAPNGLGEVGGMAMMAAASQAVSAAVAASGVVDGMGHPMKQDGQHLMVHHHNGDSRTAMMGNTGAMYLSDKPSFKFFVGGIHPEAWEDDVRKHFSQFGTVKEVQVMKDHATGRNRGFGFVTMVDTGMRDAIFNGVHAIKSKKVEVRDMQPEGTSNLKRKVFIGGVNPALDEEQLRDYFRHYGGIEKVTIMRDSVDGKSRGFGFVVYVDEIAVKKVLEKTVHYIDGDNKVEVRAAEARHRINSQRGRGDMAGRGGRGAPPYGYPDFQGNAYNYNGQNPFYGGRGGGAGGGGAFQGYGNYAGGYGGYGAAGYSASAAYAPPGYAYGGAPGGGYGGGNGGYGAVSAGGYGGGSYGGMSGGVYGSSGSPYGTPSAGYGSSGGGGYGMSGGGGYGSSSGAGYGSSSGAGYGSSSGAGYGSSSGAGYGSSSGAGYGSSSGYGGSRGGQGYFGDNGGQSATGENAQQAYYLYGPHRATGVSQGVSPGRGRGYRTVPY